MESRNIGFNLEYEKLREQYEALKTELAKLLTDKDILIKDVLPNIEALFNVKIGQKYYEAFCIECQVRRLKRKLQLIQASINSNLAFSNEKIEEQLEKEFIDWQKQIEAMKESIKNSEDRLNNLMTLEETKEIQSLYKKLAKKLHPDINPNQSEEHKNLWFQVSEAYEFSDLEELKAIYILVENYEENIDFKDKNEIESLKARIEYIKERINDILRDINEVKSKFPYSIKHNLEDDEWVNNEIMNTNQKIKDLNSQKKILEQMLKEWII